MIRIAIVAAALVASASSVSAQGIAGMPMEFGVMGGVTKPVGSFSSVTSDDWNLGGLVMLGPRESTLRFRLDGQWQQIGGNPPGARLACIPCGNGSFLQSYHVVDATANAVVGRPMFRSARMYLIGGIGVYNARRGSVVITNAVSERQVATVTRFGLNGGAGISIDISRHSLFVEARYHNLVGGDSFGANGITGDGPGSFQFVPINVGFTF